MKPALAAPGVALTSEALIALRGLSLRGNDTDARAALPGGFVTRRRGQGQEVADVRKYVSGDDIRHLDRGSTARTGILHVRAFQEERDRATLLVADFRASMFWGTRRAFRSVAAAEVLSLIGWRAVEDGGRVGLLAFGAGAPVVVPIRGKARGMLLVIGGMVRAHADALQEAVSTSTDPPLDRALARVARLSPAGADIVIASGFEQVGAAFVDRLGQLAQRRHPRLLRVDDGIGALPPGNYPIRLPDGTHWLGRPPEVAQSGLPDALSGFPMLRIDAAAPLVDTAAIIAARFPGARGPGHG